MVAQSRSLYQRLQKAATGKRAVQTMALTSFCESFVSPFPPDLLLVPMILSHPKNAWRLAFICTLTSLIGGGFGYTIGYFLYESLGQWIINTYGLEKAFGVFQDQFQKWGFWIIALKGFTPIPYKVLTLSSGLAKYNFLTFFGASIIARSSRFFLLAGLLLYFGPTFNRIFEKYSWWFFAATMAIIILGFVGVKVITN